MTHKDISINEQQATQVNLISNLTQKHKAYLVYRSLSLIYVVGWPKDSIVQAIG